MIDDIKKSISATLYERTTSPLFGTFFFTWIIWNWKIVIVLFMTTSTELEMTKFEYIETNLLNSYNGVIYPLISTLLILTLYSWLALQSYRLWLIFDNKKNNYKNKSENSKLLTVEQSMKLRVEISKKEEGFENIIKDKEDLIAALKNENTELLDQINTPSSDIISSDIKPNNSAIEKVAVEEFFNNEEAVSHLELIADYIQHGWSIDSEKTPSHILSYYLAFDIIEKSNDNGVFEFTQLGKSILREYFKRKTKPNN